MKIMVSPMKICRVLFVLGMVLPVTTWAQENEIVTLPDILQLTEKRYPLSGEIPLLQDQRVLTQENLKRSWYPGLNISAKAAYYSDVVTIEVPVSIPGLEFPQPYRDQYSVALDVRQLIYDGGVTRLRQDLESGKSDIQEQDVRIKLNSFKKQVTGLFFGAVFLDDNYAILKENLSRLETAISEAEAAVRNGVLLRGDLNVLLAARIGVQQQMESNRYDRKAVTDMLGQYLDTVFYDSVKFVIPDPPPVAGNVSPPELQMFKLRSDLLEANIKLEEAMRRPRLSGFGQLGYGRPGLNPLNENFNTYYLFGVQFTWNIWDWNKTKRQKKILTLQQQQILRQSEAFRSGVDASLKKLTSDIAKLDRLISLDIQKTELLKQITDEYSRKLSAGTITPAAYEKQWTEYRQAMIALNLHEKQKQQKQIEYIITHGNISDYEKMAHQ